MRFKKHYTWKKYNKFEELYWPSWVINTKILLYKLSQANKHNDTSKNSLLCEHARFHTRKNENDRCLLSLITSDDRIEILKIVFLFDLYSRIHRYFLQLVSFNYPLVNKIFLTLCSWPFSIMHTFHALLSITHSNESLLPGNKNTRDRFWPIACADFEQWTKIIY